MSDDLDRKPEPQHEGYLVVMRPGCHARHLDAQVERWSEDPAAYRSWRDELRRSLGGLDAARYAGVAREPIDRWLEPPTEQDLQAWHQLARDAWVDPQTWDPSLLTGLSDEERRAMAEQGPPGPPDLEGFVQRWGTPLPPDPDERARRLMFERLGPDPNLHWQVEYVDSCLLPDPGLAREVLALTGRPDDREIVHVARSSEPARATLGFDVGQWGGSAFSIVLDTMLHPQWHPAPDDVTPALAAFARQLNEHHLFATAEAAQAFHDWYVVQPWAEIGTFPVIRVDAVPA